MCESKPFASLVAAMWLASACSSGSSDSLAVRLDLRLALVEGRGDGLTACAPRDPVSPLTSLGTAIVSRDPDLQIYVEVGDTIEATRVPAVALGDAASPEVWVAQWVVDELEDSTKRRFEQLAWCDVIIAVSGVAHGRAELRPETGRLPAGTFASLQEVKRAFSGANVVPQEVSEFEAAEMASFWQRRDRDTWRLIACDAALRDELERTDPGGFAAALEEVSRRGAVDCEAREGEADDRVR